MCIRHCKERKKVQGAKILEPCAGEGHIAETLKSIINCEVTTNDLINRNYELDHHQDFLGENKIPGKFDVVLTNPPFKFFKDFILKSFEYADNVILFGRIQILEGKSRKEINEKYLKKVYVYSHRVNTAKNGDEKEFKKSSAMCFCWFVYEKNKVGETIIEWI